MNLLPLIMCSPKWIWLLSDDRGKEGRRVH